MLRLIGQDVSESFHLNIEFISILKYINYLCKFSGYSQLLSKIFLLLTNNFFQNSHRAKMIKISKQHNKLEKMNDILETFRFSKLIKAHVNHRKRGCFSTIGDTKQPQIQEQNKFHFQ